MPPPPYRRSADPLPSVATQTQVPARPSRPGIGVVIAVLILAGAGAAFYFTAAKQEPPSPVVVPGATAAPPSSVPPVTIVAPAPSTSAVVAPALPISASAVAPATTDLAACVKPLFPAESFDAASDFAFVCAEVDPIKGGAGIRTQLVRARKNMSDGMKEWALLGWYELAAFSVLRAHCCPSAPPLQLPELPRGCTPVPEALGAIAAAAAATTDPDDKALKKAVDAYTDDVHCINRAGIAARFGRVGNPQGGEDTTFTRFLGRVVAAKR